MGIRIGMRVRCRYRIGPYIDYIIMCGCSLRKARISPYTLSSPSLPSLTLSVSYILNLPISPQIFVITALILHSSLSLCSLTLSLPSLSSLTLSPSHAHQAVGDCIVSAHPHTCCSMYSTQCATCASSPPTLTWPARATASGSSRCVTGGSATPLCPSNYAVATTASSCAFCMRKHCASCHSCAPPPLLLIHFHPRVPPFLC